VNRFVFAGKMVSHPPDVSQKLTNRLIRRLLALQLYHKPSTFSLVLREQINPPYVAGIFVTAFLVALLTVDRPIFAEFDLTPIIAEKLVQMSFKTETLVGASQRRAAFVGS
jgi:hypothetical protein